MKKFVFAILVYLFTIPVFAQVEPLCTAIPVERERDLRLAAYSVAHDVLAESEATAYHAERLLLARLMAQNPAEWWRLIAEYRQGYTTNCVVNWSALTYDQLKTNMNAAWTEIARLKYETTAE